MAQDSLRHQEMFLSAVLGMLMLENGDPRLESFTEISSCGANSTALTESPER
ncbi:hypothetical protein [Klebsiella pneumoniae]|uniref:hypothetical protein n=1 Tax=Klebsiella pneumoniae TaxID=573 RepID=UPI00296F8781|nr:hypothetical protein [Klebsiella pneumoniae]